MLFLYCRYCPQSQPTTIGQQSQQAFSSPSPFLAQSYSPLQRYQPTSLEQQIAMSGLQKHGFETLEYQQQLSRNPFLLKFHQNVSTSCTELLNALGKQPVSSNKLLLYKVHKKNSNIVY